MLPIPNLAGVFAADAYIISPVVVVNVFAIAPFAKSYADFTAVGVAAKIYDVVDVESDN